MHFRRLACLLLGAWLAGTILVATMATENFRTVDRLLLYPNPTAWPEIKTMGNEFSRMLFRWEAGEQNRTLFVTWETAQLALAVAVFFVLLFGSTESKFSLGIALLMLVIVMVQRVLLTPLMTSLGRLIDFVPPTARSADRVKFQVLHFGYVGAEGFKLVLGMILAVKLTLRSRRKLAQAAGDIDVIDKTNHRHVNR